MATSMEADSEVLFKVKREGKDVKTETAVDDATLWFDFRASTPATSPPGRGAEHRGGDGKVSTPYPVTSTGNQYCLMVGCYFSKWLECFPIPDQKATTVARKLVYEIVARYRAFRELHSDQGTNFGSKVV